MGSYDEAEHRYREAIRIDPNRTTTLTNYARFLREIRNDSDGAEELHKRAVNSTSVNPYNLRSYAKFLADVQNPNEAEVLFKRAIDLDRN